MTATDSSPKPINTGLVPTTLSLNVEMIEYHRRTASVFAESYLKTVAARYRKGNRADDSRPSVLGYFYLYGVGEPFEDSNSNIL